MQAGDIAFVGADYIELVNVSGTFVVTQQVYETQDTNYIIPTAVETLDDVVITDAAGTTRRAQGTDYDLDIDYGYVRKLSGGGIIDTDVISYDYEAVSREADVVKVKNKFKSPADSGYRDLNLLVRLPKTNIIAEVQLHLKAIADVKSGPEHELYEIIQGIERNALAHNRPINDIEAAQINNLRSQSLELYQQAWQPYITTHIKAA